MKNGFIESHEKYLKAEWTKVTSLSNFSQLHFYRSYHKRKSADIVKFKNWVISSNFQNNLIELYKITHTIFFWALKFALLCKRSPELFHLEKLKLLFHLKWAPKHFKTLWSVYQKAKYIQIKAHHEDIIWTETTSITENRLFIYLF